MCSRGGSDWSYYQLPTAPDFKAMDRLLGHYRYCRLQILDYGEIACPLYQLIKEAQKNNFSILVWEPNAKKAFKQLKKAPLQASALSLPTDQ